MAIISEIGLEGIKKFSSAKQFTAWLRLAPNNKISGGKVLSHHIPKLQKQITKFDIQPEQLGFTTA